MGYTNCKCRENWKSCCREFHMQGNELCRRENSWGWFAETAVCKHDSASQWVDAISCTKESQIEGFIDAQVERVPSGSKIECRKRAKKPNNTDWGVQVKPLNAKFSDQICEAAGIQENEPWLWWVLRGSTNWVWNIDGPRNFNQYTSHTIYSMISLRRLYAKHAHHTLYWR